MVLQPVETTTTQLIMNLIKKSLVEEDKFVIVRGKVVCVGLLLSLLSFVVVVFCLTSVCFII